MKSAATTKPIKPAHVKPDSKGRITLGKLALGISSFKVEKMPNGNIMLEPYAEIPERERWLYANPAALAAVREGLKQAAEGKVVKRESYAKYLDDDID